MPGPSSSIPTTCRRLQLAGHFWLLQGDYLRAQALITRALALSPDIPRLRAELERDLARARQGGAG